MYFSHRQTKTPLTGRVSAGCHTAVTAEREQNPFPLQHLSCSEGKSFILLVWFGVFSGQTHTQIRCLSSLCLAASWLQVATGSSTSTRQHPQCSGTVAVPSAARAGKHGTTLPRATCSDLLKLWGWRDPLSLLPGRSRLPGKVRKQRSAVTHVLAARGCRGRQRLLGTDLRGWPGPRSAACGGAKHSSGQTSSLPLLGVTSEGDPSAEREGGKMPLLTGSFPKGLITLKYSVVL